MQTIGNTWGGEASTLEELSPNHQVHIARTCVAGGGPRLQGTHGELLQSPSRSWLYPSPSPTYTHSPLSQGLPLEMSTCTGAHTQSSWSWVNTPSCSRIDTHASPSVPARGQRHVQGSQEQGQESYRNRTSAVKASSQVSWPLGSRGPLGNFHQWFWLGPCWVHN